MKTTKKSQINNLQFKKLLITTCLLAGKIMIANGSETYRVEDTIHRIAASAHMPDEDLFTLPTGIFLGDPMHGIAQIRSIPDRTTNLRKIDAVNQASRLFAQNAISLPDLHRRLEEIEQQNDGFPLYLRLLGAALTSFTMFFIFASHYDLNNLCATAVIGALGYYINDYLNQWLHILFLNQLFAALAIGTTTLLLYHYGWISTIHNLIISAVMPLVPGVAITNSFRDLIEGHLITGLAHGAEACLCAAAIGIGIALIFKF